jgi:hypothetical protein
VKRVRITLLAMALAIVPATAAMGQTAEGEVIVVHGVPDLAVDIYVNGDLTFENSEFGDVFGPLPLPEGSYDIEVYATGADPTSEDPALIGSADLPAGAVATIAAYLQEGGAPTLGVFVENNSATAAGEARITARHLADFGAVDVLANDAAVWEGVANGAGADTDVPADSYNIKITAAGDPSTVAFDQDLALADGTNTIAYAIGSVPGGSFQVAAASLSGLASAPEGVPTGDAGLAGQTGIMIPAALVGLAAIALGGSVLVARKVK